MQGGKMMMERNWPVTLKVDIEPEGLKRVVEQGRLLEFVDAFSTLAAGHIRVQLVEQLARAGVGLAEAGRGMDFAIGFDVDDPYRTGPKPWPGPWPGLRLSISQIREQIREELAHMGKP
jgi:hypothetical protein